MTMPTARFLTGADGNYYFDLDPTFEYEIRITDPLDRIKLDGRRYARRLSAALSGSRGASRPTGSSHRIATIRSWPANEPGEIFFGSPMPTATES